MIFCLHTFFFDQVIGIASCKQPASQFGSDFGQGLGWRDVFCWYGKSDTAAAKNVEEMGQ